MKRPDSRNRLLLALTTILVLAFVGVSFLNYFLTRERIHREILSKDLPLTMDNIYSELTAELMRPVLVSSSMASDTFLKDWVRDGEQETIKVIRYLDQIRKRYGFFSTFFISARTLAYYHFKGIHKTIRPNDSHDVWYYRLVESDREYDLDIDTDEASGNTLTIFINYKVFDGNGGLLGVTGVGLKLDMMAELVKTYEERYGRSVYLTDRQGVIQVHRNLGYIEKKNIRTMEGLGGIAAEMLATGDRPENFEYRRNGELILLTARYIPALDWMLCVEQNETRSLAGERMTFIRTVLAGLVASVFIIGLTLATINRYQSRLEQLIVTDDLTGVANRRQLEKEFARAMYVQSRTGQAFSLLLIDLDGFKKVNDSIGHQAGDEVLAEVAKLIAAMVRPTDILARWGGDEFVILSASTLEEAEKMADRIRAALAGRRLAGPGSAADDPRNLVTLSCGITGYGPEDGLDSMLARADHALYRCKESGGNAVAISS
jgi:diguanylate cyclase (GGDEF)-like protein